MSKLYVFAHQDDEVAIAPRIARDVASGARVVCAFLTDGGAPAVRDAESRAVLASLGVHDVIFVGLPERTLVEHLEEAYHALKERDAEEIITLAWEGGHQDHDAAHLVALALAKIKGVRCLECPLYRGYFRVLSPLRVSERRRLTARDVAKRAMLCWRYPSQRRSWLWLGGGVGLRGGGGGCGCGGARSFVRREPNVCSMHRESGFYTSGVFDSRGSGSSRPRGRSSSSASSSGPRFIGSRGIDCRSYDAAVISSCTPSMIASAGSTTVPVGAFRRWRTYQSQLYAP